MSMNEEGSRQSSQGQSQASRSVGCEYVAGDRAENMQGCVTPHTTTHCTQQQLRGCILAMGRVDVLAN